MGKRRRRFAIEDLLNDSAEPVFVLNADREVVFFNRACAGLTGRNADQVMGLTCPYRGATGAADLPDLAASLAPPPEVLEGRATTIASLFIGPDGQRLMRHIQFSPCHDEAGQLAGVIGLVSERADRPEQLTTFQVELHEGLLQLRERLQRRFGFDKVIGASESMARVMAQVRVAAQSDANVLILGEPGTGKSLIARTIHRESSRRAAPFLPIDCGLLPAEMLDRDLFGSEDDDVPRRASKPGLVERAEGGVLFLKYVSKLPRDSQAKLSAALNRWRDEPSTGRQKAPMGVRIVAVESRDPSQALAAGELRTDLYYALSTIVIGVPPLRERKNDLPPLAQWLVESVNAGGTKQVGGFNAAALDVLMAYDWPGNVRELHEVIVEAHARCQSSSITADDITPRIQGAWGGAFAAPANDQRVDLEALLRETERKAIEQAIKKARGNKSQAAELLSISRPRLYRRMQVLGMNGADRDEPTTESDVDLDPIE
jgi:DNA-binding NtrC family response regulator